MLDQSTCPINMFLFSQSQLQIRWTKEGSPLPELSVDDAQGLLVLRNVRVSDSGVYVCQVSDGITFAVEKVTLTVGGKIIILC